MSTFRAGIKFSGLFFRFGPKADYGKPYLLVKLPSLWPSKQYYQVATLGNEQLEAFGLIRIALQFPIDGQTYTAWIIIPEGHPNSYHGDDIGDNAAASQLPPPRGIVR